MTQFQKNAEKYAEACKRMREPYHDFKRFRCENNATSCTLYEWSCREGYARGSYACSECAPDFYRSSRQCFPCPKGAWETASAVVAIACSVALVIWVVLHLAFSKHRGRPSAALALLMTHLQMMNVVVRTTTSSIAVSTTTSSIAVSTATSIVFTTITFFFISNTGH